MREEDMNNLSRLIPRRTATVYFILFLSTLLISITIVNTSERVFREYTSCHGDHVYDISIFMILLLMQTLLLLLKVKDGTTEEEITTSDADIALSFTKLYKDGNLMPSKKLSETLAMTSKRYMSSDGFVGIVCDAFNSRSTHEVASRRMSTRPLDSAQSIEQNEPQIGRKGSISTIDNNRIDNTESAQRGNDYLEHLPRPCQHSFASLSICWNSLWMLFYHLVLFMGMHATLLASRVHGEIELNKYALETCSHLWDKFPLGMWSPKMKYPLFNENAFFLTYLACTSFELLTRKSADASYVGNFFKRHFFKDCRLFGTLRIMLQCIIFIYGGYIVVVSVIYGYGSPMQIISGFSFGMLALWINAALTQLLQLSHMSTSSLDLNWLWSLLSALNFWICGILFYISVYGIPFNAPYIYLQICAWIPILILTKQRGKQIFEWRDISYALYTFN